MFQQGRMALNPNGALAKAAGQSGDTELGWGLHGGKGNMRHGDKDSAYSQTVSFCSILKLLVA